MAPGYRHGAPTRRSHRNHADHDVYEGLPVRQWRRETVHVIPPPPLDTTSTQQSIWDVELPWGMPKDSHLLAQHSQELLRAARSGRIYKRPPPEGEETEADGDAAEAKKKEQQEKEKELAATTLSAKAWKQIPRHLEGADVEFLAKRRKGLVGNIIRGGNAVASVAPPVVTLKKATVRRVDSEGKTYTTEVVAAEGEKIEGEVISQVTITEPVETAPKRRPPIGRKKKHHLKGRKRKVESLSRIATITAAEGAMQDAQQAADGTTVKVEDSGAKNGDDMRSDSGTPGAGDGSDGSDDEGEDGEEGDEGDDQDDQDEDTEAAATSDQSVPPQPTPNPVEPAKSPLVVEVTTDEIQDTDMVQSTTEAPVEPPAPDAMVLDNAVDTVEPIATEEPPSEDLKPDVEMTVESNSGINPENIPDSVVKSVTVQPISDPPGAVVLESEIVVTEHRSEPSATGEPVLVESTTTETVSSILPPFEIVKAPAVPALTDYQEPKPEFSKEEEIVAPESAVVEVVDAPEQPSQPEEEPSGSGLLDQLEQHLDAQVAGTSSEALVEQPAEPVTEPAMPGPPVMPVEPTPEPPAPPATEANAIPIEGEHKTVSELPVEEEKPIEPPVSIPSPALVEAVEATVPEVSEAAPAEQKEEPLPEPPKEPEVAPAPAPASAPAAE